MLDSTGMPRFDARRIRHYYDRHTPAFVSFGQGGEIGAIHRAVWGPAVTDRTQAFHYVEDRIAAVLEGLDGSARPLHVVDLGCGVGGSLCYLAEGRSIRGTGITLSPAQAALAQVRIAQRGLADRVVCREGDFSSLPADIGPADLAFAIESFVHAADPAGFFAECARLVRPGGALIICDDVLRTTADARAHACVERFCRGWHVNTLLTHAELSAHASEAGFATTNVENLTPHLELGRPRDRLIAALVAAARWLPGRWPRLDPLLGGAALQTCLTKGWIGYELSVFRRTLQART